ncbi:MAG: DUF4387 domain-containing protein [Defluviitaleaceae bacterium]|nr:DUF4387 domain-containing protein [Defluviitaleaceae bacterium]
MYKLIDQVDVVRSKNSGPYELTFDIMFKDKGHFDAFVDKQVMTEAVFAQLYGINVDMVKSVISFAPSKAVKITIVRPMASGDLGEKDIYGAQQHSPLLGFTYTL